MGKKISLSLEVGFGKVLRELRLKTDLSQEQLALETGYDRTYVSLLERGLRQPTLKTLFAFAKTLGIKPSKMIELVEQQTNLS